jgi:glycosyltransferase involved in cell wall biosynthesis
MPKVSVVIPSYNHAAYITDAVASVLSQSERDLELIVVDDGSSDDTLAILQRVSDERFRVIPQANQGAHAAINRGLREATAEYLAILDSDDAYHPNRLEKALAIMENDADTGLVGSHIEIVDSQNRRLGIKHGYRDCPPWVLQSPQRSFRAGQDLRAALLTENYWSTTSNFVFRRTTYMQVGEFRPLRYAHDWDFALRMARLTRLALVPEPLVRYRVHETNTIRTNHPVMIFEICWCLAVHLPRHARDPWFAEAPIATRADQLLHSIYAFGMERILTCLLLLKPADDSETELSLLDPENATRARCIEWITEELARQGSGAGSGTPVPESRSSPAARRTPSDDGSPQEDRR